MAQYVITDGTRWVMRDRNNKYVPTSNEALADVFGNKEANSVYQNNLPKALKSVFHIQKNRHATKVGKTNHTCRSAREYRNGVSCRKYPILGR